METGATGQGPPSGRLEERAIRGVRWTLLAHAATRVIGFATTVVLARLLVPSEFGLFALAMVAVGAAGLFSDLGLGGVLVVRQDLDERAKGTLLTLMTGTGLGLALLLGASAPFVAAVLGDTRLTPLLMALAATLLLGGPSWFYETVLQRELEFWRRFWCGTGQSLSYAAVAIPAAALGAGVWSLVAGHLVALLVYTALLVGLAPRRVRPAFDRGRAREAMREGRGFVLQSGLGFVELNVDFLAVGRLLGSAPLGFYSMAFRLGELPYWAVTEPVAKVTFPGFARMRARGHSTTAAYLSVLGLVARVACPLGVLLSAAAGPFTAALLGDRWAPAVGPLMVLGLWGTINHLEATAGWLLNSVGRAGDNAAVSALMLAPLVLAVFVAARWGDVVTVAWVLVGHVTLALAARAAVLHRRGLASIARQWRAVRPVAFGAPAAWLACRLVADAASDAPPPLALAAAIAAGVTAYGAVMSLVEPGVIGGTASQLFRTVRPPGDGTRPERDV